jgi:uncharacterized protein (UPF0333 family)
MSTMSNQNKVVLAILAIIVVGVVLANRSYNKTLRSAEAAAQAADAVEINYKADRDDSGDLTVCKVCNGKVSSKATACPHCGDPR